MKTALSNIDRLVGQAVSLGLHTDPEQVVAEALKEYIARHESPEQKAAREAHARDLIDSFGTFDFDPAYDYKKQRNVK